MVKQIRLKEDECYKTLLAHILYQTIIDHTGAKRHLAKVGEDARYWAAKRKLYSCEQFFDEPPYDYGDIDLGYIKTLCDERARTGEKVAYDFTRA